MTLLDWLVLVGSTLSIVLLGTLKVRRATTSKEFLSGGKEMGWVAIGISVMATQASAITFLSVPGQAYEDGMRFVQFYFGLPLAMIIISAVFIPIYYRLNVVTAYEYLESRFDMKTRLLGALLFLTQRGLATGITIYAPSIILSAILGWPLEPTIVVMGVVVIVYTAAGGSRAVTQTQQLQMAIMMGGLLVAAIVVVMKLPEHVRFGDAIDVAGAFGRMNVVSFELTFESRYNIWAGLTGGLFLQLSYFGTDQSQVGRYLTGKSITEGRLGLLFNGMLKIPMQFFILGVGILVFVFYQFTTPPLLFNGSLRERVEHAGHAAQLAPLDENWAELQSEKRAEVDRYLAARSANDHSAIVSSKERMCTLQKRADELRKEARTVVGKVLPGVETKDSDYIFITFVKDWLPPGLLGLLIAVILCAAMSAVASQLNALGATTTTDLYKRVFRPDATDAQALRASRAFTVFWGLAAVAFASVASLLDNLIQAVNILGSIFYGTILGLFLVAFFMKWVRGNAVFIAACISQVTVFLVFAFTDLGYLWFNVIGCALVMLISAILDAPRRA